MNAHVFWSPDNRLIYFRNITRGNTNIWAVPADGNGYATQITNFEGATQSLDVAGHEIKWMPIRARKPGLASICNY
jgi:hypothetical protein